MEDWLRWTQQNGNMADRGLQLHGAWRGITLCDSTVQRTLVVDGP